MTAMSDELAKAFWRSIAAWANTKRQPWMSATSYKRMEDGSYAASTLDIHVRYDEERKTMQLVFGMGSGAIEFDLRQMLKLGMAAFNARRKFTTEPDERQSEMFSETADGRR